MTEHDISSDPVDEIEFTDYDKVGGPKRHRRRRDISSDPVDGATLYNDWPTPQCPMDCKHNHVDERRRDISSVIGNPDEYARQMKRAELSDYQRGWLHGYESAKQQDTSEAVDEWRKALLVAVATACRCQNVPHEDGCPVRQYGFQAARELLGQD